MKDTRFKKGQIPWNKGKPWSQKHRDKFKMVHKHQKPWLGKSRSEETKEKLSKHFKAHPINYWKGKHRSEETKRKLRSANTGKKHTLEARIKIGNAGRGSKNWRWKGGITPQIIKIRNSLATKVWRELVFERDNYICQICGQRGKRLEANHIRKFSKNPHLRFEVKNGITLCRNCHRHLVNFHEEEWESYFKFNLETRRL